ncbi:MAG: D-glycerate dehydrogenase [Candidatus Hydrogenedentes bacterium]|nr:D-glycerate dehydrogenase [Candidatus Hydrogenedentota bacterium]
MPRIVVCRMIPDAGLKLLRAAFGEEHVHVAPQDGPIERDRLLDAVRGADALLPILTDRVDGEAMDAAGVGLRVIANYAVGYNNIDVAAATERGIPVTNTPGVLTDTTADTAWAILMMTARRFGEAERYVRAGNWGGWGPMQLLGVDVHGKTLGIFGMGRIGQAMAWRAQGFRMRVIYYDPARPEVDRDLAATAVDKPTLLAESDFISIHCPLMPETTHAFGPAEFAAMKPSACLINTARGPVVDEAALADALKSGTIHAAGLDVFEDEPAIHPKLLDCENAVLIPHLGSATEETRGKMARIAAENIVAVLTGKRPPNCVNPEVL